DLWKQAVYFGLGGGCAALIHPAKDGVDRFDRADKPAGRIRLAFATQSIRLGPDSRKCEPLGQNPAYSLFGSATRTTRDAVLSSLRRSCAIWVPCTMKWTFSAMLVAWSP